MVPRSASKPCPLRFRERGDVHCQSALRVAGIGRCLIHSTVTPEPPTTDEAVIPSTIPFIAAPAHLMWPPTSPTPVSPRKSGIRARPALGGHMERQPPYAPCAWPSILSVVSPLSGGGERVRVTRNSHGSSPAHGICHSMPQLGHT